MSVDEELFKAIVLFVLALISFIALSIWIGMSEPKCPAGLVSKYSRGWYCVVEPLSK